MVQGGLVVRRKARWAMGLRDQALSMLRIQPVPSSSTDPAHRDTETAVEQNLWGSGTSLQPRCEQPGVSAEPTRTHHRLELSLRGCLVF